MRKPQFFHTFSIILILSNYRKCMGKSRFSKNWSRTSLHSRFSVLFLWTRKLLFSKRKHRIYEFRKKQRGFNSNTNLRISLHLALITHDATLSVDSSIGVLYETPKLRQQQLIVFLNSKRALVPTSVFSHLWPLSGKNDRVFSTCFDDQSLILGPIRNWSSICRRFLPSCDYEEGPAFGIRSTFLNLLTKFNQSISYHNRSHWNLET